MKLLMDNIYIEFLWLNLFAFLLRGLRIDVLFFWPAVGSKLHDWSMKSPTIQFFISIKQFPNITV